MQNFLWNEVVCRPIEENLQDINFFKIVDPFYELITPKSIPTSNADLDRLKKIFQKSFADETLQLIDPDCVKFYEQPAAYYLRFYRLIAETLKTRDDVKSRIDDNVLLSFIERCLQVGKFIDELQPGGLTIYFFIALAYSVTILTNKCFNEKLADKILTLWFDLNEVKTKTIET